MKNEFDFNFRMVFRRQPTTPEVNTRMCTYAHHVHPIACTHLIVVWIHLRFVQQLILHEVVEIAVAELAVKVVHDVAAVHDLAEDVPQIRPRYLAT